MMRVGRTRKAICLAMAFPSSGNRFPVYSCSLAREYSAEGNGPKAQSPLPCCLVLSFSLTWNISLGNNLGRQKPHEERQEVTMSDWETLYKEAILETDWSKIEERIEAADSAISARLDEFSVNHGGTPEENQLIQDALNGLTVLRREVVAWKSKPHSTGFVPNAGVNTG
jgi:hypothetical protein